MRTLLYLSIIITLAMISCTTTWDEPFIDNTTNKISNRFISPNEACLIAERAFVDFGFEKTSRSSRTAVTRLYQNHRSSRKTSTDSTFFIVEFLEGGFVVVAAPRTANPQVLAISEHGQFSIQDNPNLQFYMDCAIEDLEMTSSPSTIMRPSILDSLHLIPTHDSTITYHDRFLPTIWGQWKPYNKYCPLNSTQTGNCPAGCAAVAACQIFAFHRRPAKFGDTIFNWNAITKYSIPSTTSQYQIAYLLASFGKTAKTQYSDTISNTRPSNMLYAIKNFGYKNSQMSESLQKSIESIKSDGPIIINGYKNKIESENESEVNTHSGHAWVADAAKIISHAKVILTNKGDTIHDVISTDRYLHMNWGAGGNYDDYFFVRDNNNDVLGFGNFRYIININ